MSRRNGHSVAEDLMIAESSTDGAGARSGKTNAVTEGQSRDGSMSLLEHRCFGLMWLLVLFVGVLVQETSDFEDPDGRPAMGFALINYGFIVVFVFVTLHFFALYRYGLRVQMSKTEVFKILRKQAFLHLLCIFSVNLIQFAIFEQIRLANRSSTNPDGEGYDISGHILYCTTASFLILFEFHKINIVSQPSLLRDVFWYTSRFYLILLLIESFFTISVYHVWYESILAAAVGSGIGAGIYIWLAQRPAFSDRKQLCCSYDLAQQSNVAIR